MSEEQAENRKVVDFEDAMDMTPLEVLAKEIEGYTILGPDSIDEEKQVTFSLRVDSLLASEIRYFSKKLRVSNNEFLKRIVTPGIATIRSSLSPEGKKEYFDSLRLNSDEESSEDKD